jgi:hypothetical protein
VNPGATVIVFGGGGSGDDRHPPAGMRLSIDPTPLLQERVLNGTSFMYGEARSCISIHALRATYMSSAG